MAGFGSSIKLAGESEYQRALKQITQNLREVGSEMKIVSSAYDKNDKSTQAVADKTEVLTKKLEQQNAKLDVLKNKYNEMNATYGKNSTAQQQLTAELTKEKSKLDEIGSTLGKTSKEYQNQQKIVDDLENKQVQYNNAVSKAKTEMNQAQAEINKTTKELDNLGKETKEVEKDIKSTGDGFTVFKGILADLGSKAIQSAISGIKKLGSVMIDVGKQAIESYADYEQLVGGVETLFKDSAKTVQKYADVAYKTAGISANQYMEQVTSFSASLLQGLNGDTAKAAKIADMAIIDMSDNANKMGTSMEMIQNAYQGFAKDNFTMLDNLKLGYGGTAGEMARLINESGVLGKSMQVTAQNVKDVPFDKMIEAIHKVQEQMGITGTTSKEASSTIQGSVNSMKSAWQNLLTAIADDNQDMSKSVNEFVDSAITAAKNIVPRIKVSVDGIKKLINSIVTEVFPKLKKEIPQLKPLIETFEWFIKNKSLVVGSIKAIITAFALNKIISFTKRLSDTAKSLINIAKNTALATTATKLNTTAEATNTAGKVAATTVTKGLTAATNLLNAAWKANPIGLVVTGISAAIGIFSIFKDKTDEATESQKAQSKALEEAAQKAEEVNIAYDELRQTQQKQIDAGMTEISHYESLYDELQSLVDQNGKVKQGYEARASFIVDTLSGALGIEIDKNKDLNGQLKDLTKNIDAVMEKKKAQIILDSQESLYKEAINGQTEALQYLIDAEDILNTKKSEYADLEKERNELIKKAEAENSTMFRNVIMGDIETIDKKMQKKQEEVDTAQSTYNKQTELLSKYAYDIGQYESNMALAHAGKYDEMTTVNWNYVKEYQKAGDAEKAQLEDQIKVTETNLNLLKELKDKSGSDIYDSQIAAGEKQLSNLKEQLKQYEQTTILGLDATKIQWSGGLDKILSTITGKNIEFKEDGEGNVQMYIDGVASGDEKSKEEMAKIVTDTIKEVTKKDKDAKEAGEDLIEGVNNGIKNQDKQNSVFSSIARFGASLLSKLRASLEEHSPSKATKEMGQFLLEGLGIGIEKEENSLLNQVGNVGKNVLSALQDELNQNLKLNDIQTNLSNSTSNLSGYGVNGQMNYNSLVEAFKEALDGMKIELDDEEVGSFVKKTVENAIYT